MIRVQASAVSTSGGRKLCKHGENKCMLYVHCLSMHGSSQMLVLGLDVACRQMAVTPLFIRLLFAGVAPSLVDAAPAPAMPKALASMPLPVATMDSLVVLERLAWFSGAVTVGLFCLTLWIFFNLE
jgi:hypothetical protein